MMLRAIPALLALLLLGSACFSSGDKSPSATATREAPEATATTADDASSEPDTGDDASDSGDSGALNGVFESLLGGGLGSASGSGASLEPGDPALKALLPVQKQLLLMGPDNRRRLMTWLRHVAAALELNVS
jgi:hypothetical protein